MRGRAGGGRAIASWARGRTCGRADGSRALATTNGRSGAVDGAREGVDGERVLVRRRAGCGGGGERGMGASRFERFARRARGATDGLERCDARAESFARWGGV